MSADQQLALARATRGESTHLSKAAQKVVPPFLQKLYEIVNDPKNDELIRWSDTGDSFYVLNHERFAREVLGRWFKHQKFTSFVRQLNMYGFHKIPHLQQGVLKSETDTEPWHFEHPHFHRGQPDLLCLIQRKKQPAHPGMGEDGMDMHDPHNAGLPGQPHFQQQAAPPLANLTAGQVLDINSIMNGITAIKRHQQAISADLNELKSSNQHLWQEALAARERHKKHQDTINRILKFLAGVFGNVAETVKHDGPDATNGIRRQRQRLLIGDANTQEKKRSVVEEVDDDEDRRSVRSDQAPSTPTNRFISMDTPEPNVSSPRSPAVTPNDAFGPAITDITASFRPAGQPPIRPTETLSRASSEVPKSTPTPTPGVPPLSQPQPTLSPSALTNLISAGQNMQPNTDWSAALRSVLSSPTAVQQIMQLLANQQNHPVMHPSPPLPAPAPPGPAPEPHDPVATDPHLVMHQLTPYDPPAYDWSRLRTDLPPPPSLSQLLQQQQQQSAQAQAQQQATAPASLLGSLIPKEEGPALEPLVESANRLQKTYHDASEIDADVDALQFSLNSLINGLGLDPTSVANTTPRVDGARSPAHAPVPEVVVGGGEHHDAPVTADSAADFDFDAFFNEFSARNPDGSYPDVTADFDAAHHLDGHHSIPGMGHPSAEQLSAFLDDVSSDTSMQDGTPFELPPSAAGVKRKSDVADLPPPLLSTDSSSLSAPKAKRKR